ncbi:hypothetical protein M433DRAFT_9322 [Acidomyces richmondensis BFW]|nr:hypothetical protein M433DRAFT_9322 [Acidomyces richmondensis BFW]
MWNDKKRNVEIREQIVSRHDNCETQPQRASEPSGEFDLSDQQIRRRLNAEVKLLEGPEENTKEKSEKVAPQASSGRIASTGTSPNTLTRAAQTWSI